MSKIKVPLLKVSVRRDAFSITPVTVPPYEITVLRSIFGKENVTGDETVGGYEVDPEAEHSRLALKYGAEKVAEVFGADEGERLAELVEKYKMGPRARREATDPDPSKLDTNKPKE